MTDSVAHTRAEAPERGHVLGDMFRRSTIDQVASWLIIGLVKALVAGALMVILCGCGADRNSEATPELSRPSEERVRFEEQANIRLARLESMQHDAQIAQSIMVEALSAQRLPLDRRLVERLKRNSGITLQWIGWNERGTLAVTESRDGVVSLNGRQTSADGLSALSLEGRVVLTTPTAFVMVGTIDVDLHRYPPRCRRDGAFTFRATGNRRYWRLVEKTRPCATYGDLDYVDIYF